MRVCKTVLVFTAVAISLIFMLNNVDAMALKLIDARGLYGASGVDLGEVLYDVEFKMGSCITVFNGCDDASDIIIPSIAFAIVASQALQDQVWIDDGAGPHDTSPSETWGLNLGPFLGGDIMTPYSINIIDNEVALVAAINFAREAQDSVSGFTMNRDTSVTAGSRVWADWTGVFIYQI